MAWHGMADKLNWKSPRSAQSEQNPMCEWMRDCAYSYAQHLQKVNLWENDEEANINYNSKQALPNCLHDVNKFSSCERRPTITTTTRKNHTQTTRRGAFDRNRRDPIQKPFCVDTVKEPASTSAMVTRIMKLHITSTLSLSFRICGAHAVEGDARSLHVADNEFDRASSPFF